MSRGDWVAVFIGSLAVALVVVLTVWYRADRRMCDSLFAAARTPADSLMVLTTSCPWRRHTVVPHLLTRGDSVVGRVQR